MTEIEAIRNMVPYRERPLFDKLVEELPLVLHDQKNHPPGVQAAWVARAVVLALPVNYGRRTDENCGGCLHWRKSSSTGAFGLCDRISFGGHAHRDTLACPADARGDPASLRTLPTFGCVMFEVRS